MKEKCERILELLKGGYADNLLDASERDAVDRHLRECPSCQAAQNDLAAIARLLRNAPRPLPPENAWGRIEAEIAATRAARAGQGVLFRGLPKHFISGKLAFVLAAAAALVLAATGFYLVPPATNGSGQPPSLTSLAGNDEIREPNMNFGSSIESFLL